MVVVNIVNKQKLSFFRLFANAEIQNRQPFVSFFKLLEVTSVGEINLEIQVSHSLAQCLHLTVYQGVCRGTTCWYPSVQDPVKNRHSPKL